MLSQSLQTVTSLETLRMFESGVGRLIGSIEGLLQPYPVTFGGSLLSFSLHNSINRPLNNGTLSHIGATSSTVEAVIGNFSKIFYE